MANKTERLEIRISPEDKRMLQLAAASAGLTVSALLAAQIGSLIGDAIGKAIIDGRDKKK